MADTSTEVALVIQKDGDASQLGSLTGGRKDYQIRRHGEIVSASALKTYDVATYVAGDNEIVISNLRISGRYDNAYPNVQAPTKVTLLGNEFTVLETGIASMSQFKLGDQVTLLLTEDGMIAGAVSTSTRRSNAVGIAAVEGESASVTLPNGIVLRGTLDKQGTDYTGLLVEVSSYRLGNISLNPVGTSNSTQSLNVKTAKLGNADLAANAQMFERVATGPFAEITPLDLSL